ncbi:unnamed protein product [Rangifer tarandus platyrhynchus]|uniref:Uncharacterized protein n=1 Tax=Rangifer tarandus platyrhynchus TaxID=3082113 RepID=A0ACB1KG55_RANTA
MRALLRKRLPGALSRVVDCRYSGFTRLRHRRRVYAYCYEFALSSSRLAVYYDDHIVLTVLSQARNLQRCAQSRQTVSGILTHRGVHERGRGRCGPRTHVRSTSFNSIRSLHPSKFVQMRIAYNKTLRMRTRYLTEETWLCRKE